jgi:hypothetical protein
MDNTGYIIAGILLSPFIIYLLSRVQMKGWFHEINKQLLNKSNKIKNNERDEK